MTQWLPISLIIASLIGVSACSGSTSDEETVIESSNNQEQITPTVPDQPSNDDSPSSETEESEPAVEDENTSTINITNSIFNKRNGSCADYEGYYSSDIMDIQNSRNFIGDISITVGNSTCTLQSNTIPNHNINDNSASFATDTSEVNAIYHIPITPTFASQNTALSLPVVEAVLLNGVSIDVLAAACYAVGGGQLGREKIGCGNSTLDINNPWRYDPMSPLNTFGTDSHNAHTQSTGKYHYHGNPNAMFEQDCSNATSTSPVIGFAADGFPLFGSCISDGNGGFRQVTSSYRLKTGTRQTVGSYTTPVGGIGSVASNQYDGQFRGDYEFAAGLGDLDECNGMTVDGQYGYYITNTFPWGINCFKGTVDSSFSGG